MKKVRETSKFITGGNNNVDNNHDDDNDNYDDSDDDDDESSGDDELSKNFVPTSISKNSLSSLCSSLLKSNDKENDHVDDDDNISKGSKKKKSSQRNHNDRLQDFFELIEYEVKEHIYNSNNSNSKYDCINLSSDDMIYDNNNNSSSSNNNMIYNNYDKNNLTKILEDNVEVQSEMLSLQILLRNQQSEIDRLLSCTTTSTTNTSAIVEVVVNI